MSRQRVCEITCDLGLSPDCDETSSPEYTFGDAIRQARSDGWRVGPVGAGRDACPKCRIAERMERRYGTMRPGSRNMEST